MELALVLAGGIALGFLLGIVFLTAIAFHGNVVDDLLKVLGALAAFGGVPTVVLQVIASPQILAFWVTIIVVMAVTVLVGVIRLKVFK